MIFTREEQEASELKAYTTKAGKIGAVVASAATVALCSPAYAFASEGGGVEAIHVGGGVGLCIAELLRL